MEELIGRIAASAGIDESLATKAVGIILSFLSKEGPDGPMRQILSAIPGAQETADAAGGGGGLLGGLMSGMGAMGALNDLNSVGLDMSQVQSVTSEFVGFAREKVGDGPVDEVINAIPGLSQFT